MGRNEGIMRLRGNWLEYYVNGGMVPVMPILHPAYLLRRPADKRLAWRDLQAIVDTVRSLGLKRLGQTVEVPDNGAIRGMIHHVQHLVAVEETPETNAQPTVHSAQED